MACFVVPMTEAVITTVVAHVMERKAKEPLNVQVSNHVPFCKKLKVLSNMLWGGSSLLAFEHLWHGEIEPWFPFLTAASDGSVAVMLHEMATVGTSMAALVTLVWGVAVAVYGLKAKKLQSA
ncbi:MAG: hypothetical protein Q4F84_07210 [Fibrobacter sp.]|nr:hypothetical protein [Fibrobacter sp.]